MSKYRTAGAGGDKVEEEPFIVSQTIIAIPLETRNYFISYNAHRRGLLSPHLRAGSLRTQQALCTCVCGLIILVLRTKHSFGALEL